jgi:very-short-patch-repair endonuclease
MRTRWPWIGAWGATIVAFALNTGMGQQMRTQQRAELAAGQYGIVSQRQLIKLGYSQSALRRDVASGRLHRIHRGVYAVGHTGLSPQAECLAGVLARGHKALLSHRSAAWLWGIERGFVRPVEVSVPWRGRGRQPLHVHHCPALREEDATSIDGIPVTAVPRTLLDLAASAPPRRLERGVESTERLGLLDLGQVERLLEDVKGHAGRGRLRRALTIYHDPSFTRSAGERRLLALIRKAGLPRPAVNTFVEGFELDMYWEMERFAVELDGWEAHRTRAAFESDRLRQEELKLADIEMIRVTGRRLQSQPDEIIERLKILLQRRRPGAFAVTGGNRQ